jgi:hypothetical protein
MAAIADQNELRCIIISNWNNHKLTERTLSVVTVLVSSGLAAPVEGKLRLGGA